MKKLKNFTNKDYKSSVRSILGLNISGITPLWLMDNKSGLDMEELIEYSNDSWEDELKGRYDHQREMVLLIWPYFKRITLITKIEGNASRKISGIFEPATDLKVHLNIMEKVLILIPLTIGVLKQWFRVFLVPRSKNKRFQGSKVAGVSRQMPDFKIRDLLE